MECLKVGPNRKFQYCEAELQSQPINSMTAELLTDEQADLHFTHGSCQTQKVVTAIYMTWVQQYCTRVGDGIESSLLVLSLLIVERSLAHELTLFLISDRLTTLACQRY